MTKPWETEGDAFDWTDDATGLSCVMRRNNFKAWCGYVAVEPASPLFGAGYDAKAKLDPALIADRPLDIDEVGAINMLCGAFDAKPDEGIFPLTLLARCHGGLTYADKAWWDKADGRHWFGFDCSHAGDLAPSGLVRDDGTYRTADYVRQTCAKLAKDLAFLAEHAALVVQEAA